jgi:DNA (cytosine-5)-methyltransferase 1
VTFGSLFAGIGGLDYGLEEAGFDLRWQVERDQYCRSVLEWHWPGMRRAGDAREFPPGDPKDWYVDLIAGGDPCQENSRARSGRNCTQLSLGSEFLRIVAAIRPPLVLRENPSRVRPDAPWPWWRFADGLLSLGYDVCPFRLRACCLGADHQRERLFVLAALPDADRFESGHGRGLQLAQGGPEAWRVGIWPDQPEPPRVADGVPDRVDRNRALGNAVPPPMGEFIGRCLLGRFHPTILSRSLDL